MDRQRIDRAYRTALTALLAERTPEGYWVGELSTSALSTATAVGALALVRKSAPVPDSFASLIAGGLDWLANHQNADGGWGDTVKSFSNISTTMLCRAAFHLAGAAGRHPEPLRRAEAWLLERYGKSPEEHAEAVRARYGKDRTFSVPILMTSALAGLVSWREVPPLPFELACFPQAWFRFLRLPVVSYALPALIAIGQAVHHHRPPRNPLPRLVRHLAIPKSLRVLEAIQPSSGGFLEATPLTSFVTMGLASTGRADHPVVRKAVTFLAGSMRPDGSWPIDTNLSTWVTTLAVNALAAAGDLDKLDKLSQVRDWLVKQQYQERHPYTGADPGGWAWTPLPGGVPDADDTAGAIIAMCHLDQVLGDPRWRWGAARNWLRDLQNRDGGLPTFCRGWGALPFDRSGSDLTAHALRAFARLSWGDRSYFEWVYGTNVTAGLHYLARSQQPDGSWLPLWFGNQHAPDDENPTYGTARVLAVYRDLQKMDSEPAHRPRRFPRKSSWDPVLQQQMDSEPARRGIAWLLAAQNDDGGWGAGRGTPSSIEETSLAVEVLLDAGPAAEGAVKRGLGWLIERVEAGGLHDPTPIGFYFAKLWYFEKLYPIVFAVAALGKARRRRLGE
jgi:squalene-hopene/tetraprenyl-beta-curcumene cyclase